MKSLLVVLACTGTIVSVTCHLCCSNNEFIVGDGTFMCLDPTTNKTSNTTLTKSEVLLLINGTHINFTLNAEGSLGIWRDRFYADALEKDTFCLGNYMDINDGRNYKTAVLVYLEDDPSDHKMLSYCMIVSIIFLTLTAIVYMSSPVLRDLQGKSIINLCVAFAIALTLLVVMELVPYEDMQLCAVRGFFAYFFMMSSFFWMNSISIQVLRSIKSNSTASSGWTEFIYYAVYSWGCATVLTIIVIITNYAPGNHLSPGIGYDHCWFFSQREQWAYMYSVMAILIIANICIFLYTSILLWRHSFHSTRINALRYKFCMCLRLFVVMGITWIFELAGSAHGKYSIVWVILDIINSLEGVLIFLILVVFRRRAIKALYHRGWLRCINGPVERYLAKVDDAEENVIEHTVVMSLEDKGG